MERRTVIAGAFLCCLRLPALAQAPAPVWRRIRRKAPDARLESHRRETLRWRSDIVEGGRRAIIGLSFVGCQSQCPASDLIFQLLDQKAPADVDLYTLTLTPLANDWRILAGRAEELGASQRWRWLTGQKDEAFALLDALDVTFDDPDRHSQSVLIGGRGRYDRVDGTLPSAEQLLAALG